MQPNTLQLTLLTLSDPPTSHIHPYARICDHTHTPGFDLDISHCALFLQGDLNYRIRPPVPATSLSTSETSVDASANGVSVGVIVLWFSMID